MAHEPRTDIYQNHPTPDTPTTELPRLDSAADQMILIARLTDQTDEV